MEENDKPRHIPFTGSRPDNLCPNCYSTLLPSAVNFCVTCGQELRPDAQERSQRRRRTR